MLDDSENVRLLGEILDVLKDTNSMAKANIEWTRARAASLKSDQTEARDNLNKIAMKSVLRMTVWLTIVVVVAVAVAVTVVVELSQ